MNKGKTALVSLIMILMAIVLVINNDNAVKSIYLWFLFAMVAGFLLEDEKASTFFKKLRIAAIPSAVLLLSSVGIAFLGFLIDQVFVPSDREAFDTTRSFDTTGFLTSIGIISLLVVSTWLVLVIAMYSTDEAMKYLARVKKTPLTEFQQFHKKITTILGIVTVIGAAYLIFS